MPGLTASSSEPRRSRASSGRSSLQALKMRADAAAEVTKTLDPRSQVSVAGQGRADRTGRRGLGRSWLELRPGVLSLSPRPRSAGVAWKPTFARGMRSSRSASDARASRCSWRPWSCRSARAMSPSSSNCSRRGSPRNARPRTCQRERLPETPASRPSNSTRGLSGEMPPNLAV
jgi:hypothetical protein